MAGTAGGTGPRLIGLPTRILGYARRRTRLATAGHRALPTFLIIGAARSGTTALFTSLAHHPLVVPPSKKETHYFDLEHTRSLAWYRSHFPLATQLRDGRVSGEATPAYLADPGVPAWLRGVVPSARLVVLLRNPVLRAHSQWRLRVDRGEEHLSFEDALREESARTDVQEAVLLAGEAIRPTAFNQYSYLRRGRYEEQLRRWLAVFPADQLFICGSEELWSRPETTHAQLLRFLDLTPHDLPTYPGLNHRAGTVLAPQLREELDDYFRPHNEKLYELLGRDLGW